MEEVVIGVISVRVILSETSTVRGRVKEAGREREMEGLRGFIKHWIHN